MDDVILGYLLHRAATEEGSERAVALGAGQHAYVTTRPFDPQRAKARSNAAKARVRELLAKGDERPLASAALTEQERSPE